MYSNYKFPSISSITIKSFMGSINFSLHTQIYEEEHFNDILSHRIFSNGQIEFKYHLTKCASHTSYPHVKRLILIRPQTAEKKTHQTKHIKIAINSIGPPNQHIICGLEVWICRFILRVLHFLLVMRWINKNHTSFNRQSIIFCILLSTCAVGVKCTRQTYLHQ